MKAIGNSVAYCVKEKKPCVWWAERYFKDCLCNLNDEVSFGFGIISLVCWGVAEIPQIITNFRTKSSHGVSLLFLFTWVVGDIFNLVGCLLEPATLPTQLYTALGEEEETLLKLPKPADSGIPIPGDSRIAPCQREYYYTSARSLARSSTPPTWSYMRTAKSGPTATGFDDGSSSEDEPIDQASAHKSRSKPKPIPRSVSLSII
ncbi:hypothetical protein U1Q18_011749 [Sarracenia purpurea var. burkii]